MPKKNNSLVIKTWFKIKWMGRLLRQHTNYMFVSYEKLCKSPGHQLLRIMAFVDESLPETDLKAKRNHAIGGNPMRKTLIKIEIRNERTMNVHLTIFEKIFFNALHWVAKIL